LEIDHVQLTLPAYLFGVSWIAVASGAMNAAMPTAVRVLPCLSK